MAPPLRPRGSIKSVARSLPWEIVIPATWFVASAVCWYNPQHAPSIAFMLIGLSIVFGDAVAAHCMKPATQGISIALTNAFDSFASKENSEQTDRLLDALAESISRSLNSSALVSTLKRTYTEALNDDDLQQAAIDTLQGALVKVSENEEFQETTLNLVRKAFISALRNEAFVKDLVASVVDAIVMASQDEKLTKSILGVVTQAVSEALADERFASELRGAVKDCLKDGDIYRAGAKGVFAAAFGRDSGSAGMKRAATERTLRVGDEAATVRSLRK